MQLKPSLNDFVVQDGAIYGFDDGIFCCLDLKSGKRRWKAGRYGHGQVLLLADQKLLLVMSETGEAVLLSASREKHDESAISDDFRQDVEPSDHRSRPALRPQRRGNGLLRTPVGKGQPKSRRGKVTHTSPKRQRGNPEPCKSGVHLRIVSIGDPPWRFALASATGSCASSAG